MKFLSSFAVFAPALLINVVLAQSNPTADGNQSVLPDARELPAGVGAQLVIAGQVPPVKFGPPAFIGLDSDPSTDSIAVADLNGDGKLDIVVADTYSNTVNVLLGNGDGTFQPAVSYYTDGYFGSWLALGDLRGNGILDLVVSSLCQSYSGSCGDNGVVSVLLGNGDGTFQSPTAYSSGGYGLYYTSVAIGDVNGDGHPDLVVANACQSYGNCNNGSIGVLLGNGDGTFQAPVVYTPGGSSAALADLNGDGHLDVVAVGGLEVNVLLGKGDGTFQSAGTYSSGGYIAVSVAIGDLNGDGIPDLAVANVCKSSSKCRSEIGPGGVSVLLGKGDGTFQAPVSYGTSGFWATSVAIGDVNGDGHPDLVVTDFCQTTDPYADCNGYGRVGVLLGNGDGTFQSAKGYDSGGVGSTSAAIGDLTGSGRPDLVVADDGGVGVLLNQTSYTSKTALASSPNPSLVNQTITFTATITSNPSVPNGEIVTFYQGTTKLGTGTTTNGVASLSTSFSKAKNYYTIKAHYPGDAFRKPSSGTVMQVVNP